eukprot:GILK01000858.1.p1 GENE.GILK01000858.1~~GILK01000858.1.p1  ORF type:complete len:665 (+),score=138.73 GILK01000858.1:190-1995(+)
MEEGVTVVEKLELARQPLPELDALYFLSPENESITLLLQDFAKSNKPQYKNVHLFFSSRLGEGGASRIAKSANLVSRIRHLVDFNLNFIALESQVFHFDSPDALANLFVQDGTGRSRQEQIRTAEKITTFCATLSEYPHIRFCTKTALSRHVAELVHEQLDQFYRNNGSHQFTSERATLLIVDRAIDPLAPLLHEATYQAMIHDLIENRNSQGGDAGIKDEIVEYTVVNQSGQEETKRVPLLESDELWTRLRHQHIAVVLETVANEFNAFLKNNVGSKLQRGIQKGEIEDMAQMSEAVRALPEYNELLSKYTLHMQLADKCVNIFTQKQVMRIAELEQDLATGVDKDGNVVNASKLSASLAAQLSDDSIGREEKIRLLMAYIITMEGIRESDRKKIMDVAQLDARDQKAMQNLHWLGIQSQSGGRAAPRRKMDRDLIKRAKKRAKDVPYELCRSVPTVKDIAASHLGRDLALDQYPYIVTPPEVLAEGADMSSSSASSTGKSLRQKKKYDWHVREDKKETVEAGDVKPRLIVFVLGGITYSEMRSVYELSKELGREIILGSNCILTAKDYLEALRTMPTLTEAQSGTELSMSSLNIRGLRS